MTQELVLRQKVVPTILPQEPFPVELPVHIQFLVLAHYDDPESLGHAPTLMIFGDVNGDECSISGSEVPEQLRMQLAAIGDFLRKRVQVGGESFLTREVAEYLGADIRYELRQNGSTVAKVFTDFRGHHYELLLDAEGNFIFSGKILKIQKIVRGSLQETYK